MGDEEKIVYAKYCRKSSDNEDRQVQSIETQLRELEEYAAKNNLEIGHTYTETKSAFEEGRIEFGKMLKDIRVGRYNGLLVLHTSRIARNSVDGARVIQLLDQGYLKEVRTPSNVYRDNSTDKTMLGIELIFNKKDSDDKSDLVKTGLKTKAAKGYPSGVAKIGYLNDKTGEKGNRKWIVDRDRFPIVTKLLKLFLTGKYSVRQLHTMARDEFCLRTPTRKNVGGKPIALSYLYRMLADSIYAGFFEYNGIRYEIHEELPRAITEEEYWQIQTMLGKKGRPKPQKRESLYNHFMSCSECGGGTTPDFKFQIICSNCKKKFSYLNRDACPKCQTSIESMNNPTHLTYVYYYCISRKKNQTCSKGGVSESSLEKELIEEISENITISPELSKWCIKHINELEDQELEDAIIKAQAKARELQDTETQLRNLIALRTRRSDISEAESEIYDEQQNGLTDKLNALKKQDFAQMPSTNWRKELTKDFSLMVEVEDTIRNGSFEEKKTILEDVGSNLVMTGKEVSISFANEINLFVEALKAAKAKNPKFEPKNTLADKDKTDTFASVCPTLLRR